MMSKLVNTSGRRHYLQYSFIETKTWEGHGGHMVLGLRPKSYDAKCQMIVQVSNNGF